MNKKTKTEESITNPSEVKKKKKPKWLKALETQSWQAELVVSGVAIFGAIQLPAMIDGLVDFAVYNAPAKILMILKFFFMYLYFISTCLIINFIIHFVLRALWIGMLGLTSVYPNGINPKFETFSEDYNQKLQKEFPDVSKFNENLDHLCSSIFAISAAAVMIGLSIGLQIIFMGIIAYLLGFVFPNAKFDMLFTIIAMVILIPLSFTSAFNLKFLREKSWVKKIHFPFYKFASKFIYHIFYKPVNYILMIFMTNSSFAKANIFGIVYMFLLGIFAGFSLGDSNFFFLENGRFFNHSNNALVWSANKYDDSIIEGSLILNATIQSEDIYNENIKLFIPRFTREEATVDSLCFSSPPDDDSEVELTDENRWKNRIDCHNKYYQIFINDSLITDVKFYNYRHKNRGERGYMAFIPTSNCKEGDNILKAQLAYRNPKNGEFKQYLVPFRFYKRKNKLGENSF